MQKAVFKKRKIIKRLIFILFVSFVFSILVGFFIVPPVLKKLLVDKLSENLNRKVQIEKISFNPFNFKLEIKNFKINELNSNDLFISFDRLFIDLELTSIFKKGLVIKEVNLDAPYVHVIRTSENTFNFSDLLQKKSNDKPTEKKKEFNFSINNIKISNGNIIFDDKPKNTKHEIGELKILIPFVSNLPNYIENYVNPEFFAKINGKEFSLKGATKPFKKSLETTLNIDIKNFDIPYYLGYLPFKPNFTLESCLFSSNLILKYTQHEDKKPTLIINGGINISNTVLKTKDKLPLLKLSRLDLVIADSDLIAKKINIDEINLVQPEIHLKRDEKGELNIKKIIPEMEKAEKKPENEGEEAQIYVKNINLNSGIVNLIDNYNDSDFSSKIENIDVNIKDYKSKGDEAFNITTKMNINKTGIISFKGDIKLKPIDIKMSLDLRNIAINPFQTYFEDKVNLIITDGYFNTQGNLNLKIQKNNKPNVSFSGKASITNLKTIDNENAVDLLNWKSLYLDGVVLRTDPLYIGVENISLTDFYSKIVIFQDGTLNLQKILVKNNGEEKKEDLQSQKSQDKPKIKISKVTLQNGHINFTDLYIKPNYIANMVELTGRVSGLTSQENIFADVDVKGKFENYAPLEITGKINPLRDDLFIDLKVDFKDMDLSPLTPYSGKYLGYKIEKGKLFLALKYYIEKRKLDAQNKIFFDQFDLGDRVESPTATKLPVRLAIALLKNRKGEIDLDIPVTGYIDDPEFSVWRIVIKVLINLLEKAATAPFALLGALFGGGEELSYVEFDYGLAKLNDLSIKKLETLIKALYERPALKLEIRGFVDIEKDREALRNIVFENKLKAQKLKELLKKGQQNLKLEDIKIEQEEYLKYLKLAYKEEKFPKPRTALGFEKELPKEEMEKLMLTNIIIKDDDLRILAQERTKMVKDYIIKSQKVEPERIFLIDSNTLEPERKENQKSSRVEFTLK
ncbi:MAG: DUF748 domain-containing protein [Proteobacteria bacterium]|nr:DUF748 domain-containing protein [Pseudomonadota bacterium]